MAFYGRWKWFAPHQIKILNIRLFFLENWKTLHLASSIIASPHLSDPDEAYISCFVHSFLAEIHPYTHFFSILHVLSHFWLSPWLGFSLSDIQLSLFAIFFIYLHKICYGQWKNTKLILAINKVAEINSTYTVKSIIWPLFVGLKSI